MIIGISAKMGCGKSSLASMLCLRNPELSRISFATLLKTEVSKVFDFPETWCYSEVGKSAPINVNGFLKELDETGKDVLTVRELLQWYGTDYRRKACPSYWVNAMEESVKKIFEHSKGVVIDDVRFFDEAQFVVDNKGILVRIEPYPGWKPGPYASHISETALDLYTGFNIVSRPRYGYLGDVVPDIEFAAGIKR